MMPRQQGAIPGEEAPVQHMFALGQLGQGDRKSGREVADRRGGGNGLVSKPGCEAQVGVAGPDAWHGELEFGWHRRRGGVDQPPGGAEGNCMGEQDVRLRDSAGHRQLRLAQGPGCARRVEREEPVHDPFEMAQTRLAMGWIGDCSQLLLGRAQAEAQLELVDLGQEWESQEGVREER